MNQRQGVLLVAGFLLAPLVPAFVLASQSPGLGVVPGDLASLLSITAVLYLFAVPLTALLGVPVLAVLWRLNLIRWWSALLAGFACGWLLTSVFTGFRWLSSEWFMADLPGTFMWGGCGAVAGLIIWLLYKAGDASGHRGHGA